MVTLALTLPLLNSWPGEMLNSLVIRVTTTLVLSLTPALMVQPLMMALPMRQTMVPQAQLMVMQAATLIPVTPIPETRSMIL